MIQEAKPPASMREIFIDLETTGLDPMTMEISELAALDISGNVLIHALVTVDRPEDADTEAMALNGYDANLWRERSRPWEDVALTTLELFQETPSCLVGHFVEFDRRFLECRFAAVGIDPGAVPHHVVDTQALAHEHLGEFLASRSLAHVAKVLGIAPRGPVHRALEDADLARRVYLSLRRADDAKRHSWRERALTLQ